MPPGALPRLHGRDQGWRRGRGRVPLDDIGVLLCNGRGLTYSNSLMTELARRGASVVLCGNDYLPAAWLWPVEGNHVQAMRMRCQLEASLPLRKRLWQAVVKAKIGQQAAILEMLGIAGGGLEALARRGPVRRPGKRGGPGCAAVLASPLRERLQAR